MVFTGEHNAQVRREDYEINNDRANFQQVTDVGASTHPMFMLENDDMIEERSHSRTLRAHSNGEKAKPTASDILKCFRHHVTKYSGNTKESFPQVRGEFEDLMTLLAIDDESASKYVPFILIGSARQFFWDNIRGKISSIKEIFSFLEERFHNGYHQEVKLNKMHSLDINQFMEANRPIEEALDLLMASIEELYPQTPSAYHNELNKRQTLIDAVKTQEWAAMALSQLNEDVATYTSLYYELHWCVQIYDGRAAQRRERGLP